jgi:RNA polymerase sigma factor (sigma-70 family)
VAVVPPPVPPTDLEQRRQVNEIYRRLFTPLVIHAERLLDHHSAKDAVNQTFLEIWSRWSQLTEKQRSDAYFFGAVSKTAADMRAVDDRFVSLEDAESELDSKVVKEVTQSRGDDAAAEIIERTVARMPVARREVFILVKDQGFTYQDAAAQLGLSPATVNSQIVKAYADIRAAFVRANVPLPGADQIPRLPSSTGGTRND